MLEDKFCNGEEKVLSNQESFSIKFLMSENNFPAVKFNYTTK
jgi:galactose-1-phosphate uridylyltransferase